MANVKTAILTKEECDAVQTAWSEASAMKDLMKEDLHPNALKVVIEKYTQSNTVYNNLWNELIPKYFGIDMSKEPASTTWGCDFATRVVTLTK